jgi:basic membrane lipoprotein Med (substrate-binding protein (PBP1-ABC) superfamily)
MKRIALLLSILLIATSVFAGGASEADADVEYQIGIVFDVGGRGDNSLTTARTVGS